MVELERALGQYVVYHDVLAEREPDRVLYLAIPEETMKEVFEEPIGQLLLKHNRARHYKFSSQFRFSDENKLSCLTRTGR
jgi:hypothetical protein